MSQPIADQTLPIVRLIAEAMAKDADPDLVWAELDDAKRMTWEGHAQAALDLMDSLGVRHLLDGSTGHVSEADAQILKQHDTARRDDDWSDQLMLRVVSHQYGWWIHVPTETDWDALRAETAPSVQALISYARERGCIWVNLDQDGDVLDGLAYYAW